MGLSEVLFLILLVLKLCEVITISWGWVLAPMFFSLGVGAGALIAAVILSKRK